MMRDYLLFEIEAEYVNNSSWKVSAVNDTSLNEWKEEELKGEESRKFSDDSFNHSIQA